MPYNIEPPCGENRKTIITWQYPGEELNSRDDADDYFIIAFFGSCPQPINIEYYLNYELASVSGGPYIYEQKWVEPNDGYQGKLQNVRLIRDYNDPLKYGYNENGLISNVFVDYQSWLDEDRSTIVDRKAQASVGASSATFIESSITNFRLVPQDQELFNSCVQYIIDFRKDGNFIGFVSGKQVPEVTWECEKAVDCPPNTCKVDCGNVYCCYGSDGIAVSSFSK